MDQDVKTSGEKLSCPSCLYFYKGGGIKGKGEVKGGREKRRRGNNKPTKPNRHLNTLDSKRIPITSSDDQTRVTCLHFSVT